MNLLAHAVLSFGDPEILLGQMVSDYVKGRRKLDYPLPVQQGIMLHRQIDTYTDEHEVVKEVKNIFRPTYRLYSGAFVDVAFDYFLANNTREFTHDSLFTFSQQVYSQLDGLKSQMPPAFAGMYPYMKRDNWLLGYSSRQGIFRSFGGLVHRAAFMTDSKPAEELFDRNFAALQSGFESFWPGLRAYAQHEFRKIRP